MHSDTVNKFIVILMVIFISAVFLSMIKSFLMAVFLAGIFSALVRPVYVKLNRKLNGRTHLSALITLVLVLIVVVIPLAGLTGVVTNQAIKVSQSIMPWVKKQIDEPGTYTELLEKIPYYDLVVEHREPILAKAGEMVGHVSQFLINNLSSVTMGAAHFLFMLFIWLYAMYFFLLDGDKLLDRILYYLPMKDEDEELMLDRFTSVARATLKGTAVIGILQGGLAGLAFWVVGIPSAVFWGVIMVVLSIIPSIGTAVVWGPAAIILAISGSVGKALGLLIFCGIVVGSVDNLIRPVLVGKDTQMHELMIFLGTLGGIFMFGITGMIIGPIIAALFVTIWEIYGQAFADILPDTGYVTRKKELEGGDALVDEEI
jgi:predicted PurR-regulated permease PerM